MTSISNLTASNASFILTHGNYFDFNIWVLLVATAFILLIISAFMFKRDQSGSMLLASFATLVSIASVWASLSLAHFSNVSGATSVAINNTTNLSTSTYYVYASQSVVTSPLLTIMCVLLTIFCGLNVLNILIMILEQPKMPIKNTRSQFTVDGRRIK